ncbi:succinate dehydrogenase, hydrophobic membrane anchor protein [Rhodospirillaceae bacterium SYSU D60014]|uniref:succinate dehydrogenase, hydrophobic membrane anchor protein n=1 Tax=Virgifigura deserti TaxID=2268457 RepID=UPI000E6749CD
MHRATRSYRSDLARVRGLGSAKEGAREWWMTRLTSAALVPLTVWFVVSIVGLVGADHAAVVAWLGSPVAAGIMILFIVVTFHHTQSGLKVVIEDYVHVEWLKIGAIVLVTFASIVLALAAIIAVLVIAFGD